MKSKLFYFSALMGLLLAGNCVAAEFQKIVHADGRVEYRQATKAQEKAASKSYYKYRNDQGVLSFSDRQPANRSYE